MRHDTTPHCGPLKRFTAAFVSAALILATGPAPSAFAANEAVLESVEIADDQVRIRLSGPAEFNSFMTANPPRLVIQLLDAEYQAGAKSFSGKGRFLKGVRGGQFERSPRMISRVVLDLSETIAHKLVKDGDSILVTLGTGEESPAARTAAAPRAKRGPSIKPKGAAGAPAAAAPAELGSAPAAALAALENGGGSSADLARVGEAGGMTTQASAELTTIAEKGDANKGGNQLLRSPDALPPTAPAAPPAKAPGSGPALKGDIMSRLPRDLVSLDFDNTDIRDVLKLLAAKAKINLIYGNDVSGSLTLHLNDVPFHEAFRTALSMMGLTTMQVGDTILRVLSPGQLAKTQSTQAVVTKIFTLNYAKSNELQPLIDKIRSAEGRAGTTASDIKTNSLIVTEASDSLIATERLIQQLDQRPRQVLIEAKLVEVGLTNSLHHGIQWDYASFDFGRAGGKQGLSTVGTSVGPNNATEIGLPLDQNVGVQGFGIGTLPGVAQRGTGVSLPASTVFGALTLGRVTNNYFVNATLTAAAAQGKVKVLSDPKIATLNNQAANINVTTSIPYVTSNVASTGVTSQSVSYVVTGIQMTVTPSITGDGRIMLDINPKVSQPSATAAASSSGAPAVDARDAKTTVLVRDGETIVIGGLISDSVSNQIAKIPILGDIPILGWLFKKRSIVRSRAELLIFVTPKILPD